MNAGKITAGIIVALAVVAFFSIFIVKEVNQAIVLQFGDPKRIILKPGLNFKIPFIQNVVFLDKRILNLDTPPEEVIASDQKRFYKLQKLIKRKLLRKLRVKQAGS